MDLAAPSYIGNYCAWFRLSYAGKEFGIKAWCDIVVEDPLDASEVIPDLARAQSSIKRDDYVSQANAIPDSEIRDCYLQLFAMGFKDFAKNKDLMDKNKNDLGTVANILATSAFE